jgi:hypothetical protein
VICRGGRGEFSNRRRQLTVNGNFICSGMIADLAGCTLIGKFKSLVNFKYLGVAGLSEIAPMAGACRIRTA